MELFGLSISRARTVLATKAQPAVLQPIAYGGGNWWARIFPTWIREPFVGAWQSNQEVRCDTALRYFAVFACVTLIATDIAKLCLRLVQQDTNGIWTETESASFSPVLRKPNRYQTIIKFVEQWIVSKLLFGNAYILKQRDGRGLVVALYVLDPTRVTPLVAPDGAVYYELKRDDLAGLTAARVAAGAPERNPESLIVPAREVIHDPMVCLYHPLIGVSPIYACGLAALQGLTIQNNSSAFFANGSNPGGVITVPGAIDKGKAAIVKESWETNYTGVNAGRVALLTDGMKYDQMRVSAVDAQLIEQLKWTAEVVCSCFHVPPYMVGIGPPPPYANVEPLLQQYYSQCLQTLITSFEKSLDEGLELPKVNGQWYGTEFDVTDLIWMDTATKTKAAADAIGSGAQSPNEARKKYYGLGPVKGGESPMVQQQYYSLAALAERDANKPFAKPAAPPPAAAPEAAAEDDGEDKPAAQRAAFFAALHRKMSEAELYG